MVGAGPRRVVAWFDGASKGNPGKAGAGWLLSIGNSLIAAGYCYVGDRETNNVAEYTAMIKALGCAERLVPGSHIEVRGDSMLVLLQMKGKCQVKAPHLAKLKDQADEIVRRCVSRGRNVSFNHASRGNNSAADWLANMGCTRDCNEQFLVSELCPRPAFMGATLAGVKTLVRQSLLNS